MLLNTSILTAYGVYRYEHLSLKEARSLIRDVRARNGAVESAIGHETTADLLTALLGIRVETNRIEFKHEVGDRALVFKLRSRPPEGKILSRDEIEEIGYEFGLLTRTA